MSKSQTTMERIGAIHPGEFLFEDFMEPLGLTQYRLAKALGIPPIRISEIVRGKRAITADTALRLARFFGNSARFWLGIQEQYNLDMARESIAADLDAITPFNLAV